MKQLTQIKDVGWVADVPSQSLQSVIDRLDSSYKTFFKGGGFPKWATKTKYQSIILKQDKGVIRIVGNRINLHKIGKIKMFKDSEITGSIKTVTITKEISGYFICITTDTLKSIQNQDESQVIGLDMGVKYLYVDSVGNFIENPRHLNKYENQLKIESRSLSRKKRGSNNRHKQVRRLALLHLKISNVRKDFLHKETTKIAKQYHTVVLEDLNVKGMSRNRKLSKHILDCSWGMFRIMLEYKTNVIAINPKHTSQTCNLCGSIDSKNRLSQSEFVCTECGEKTNADENAAKNILCKGIALNRKREALACA